MSSIKHQRVVDLSECRFFRLHEKSFELCDDISGITDGLNCPIQDFEGKFLNFVFTV